MDDLLSFTHLQPPPPKTTITTVGVGHDHVRDQIIENVNIAFHGSGKPWPVNSADGKAFSIIIGKRSAGTYYGAVVYRTRGAASAVKIFVSGAEAGTVEQAMVNLFDATAEAVELACGKDVERHVPLKGGGTLDRKA